jgi:SAM-dependent methyltransferase
MKTAHDRIMIQEKEYAIPYHWIQGRCLALLSKVRARIVFRFAGSIEGKRVLDFGCGDGKFSSLLLECKPSFLAGVDISEAAVAFAKAHIPQGEFIAVAKPPLPFESGSFEALFCLDVIEHIPDDEAAPWKKELLRVLRQGGKLIITVPSKTKNLDAKHFRHYTPGELRELFEAECGEFAFQGYFSRLPFVPVALLDTLYNRRHIWKLFSPLMAECSMEKALYFAMSCIKK